MAPISEQTSQLQGCLDRLQAGDESARAELLSHAGGRLHRLTRKMLKGDQRVRRWEQSGDVLQNALVRLYRALNDVRPASVCAFFRLAAVQIRRELIDLARHYYGPEGPGSNHATTRKGAARTKDVQLPYEKTDTTHNPSRLAMWAEFHQKVEELAEEEREVFDLLWYQDLPEAEAARLLNVSTRTVQRRWQAARLAIRRALHEEVP